MRQWVQVLGVTGLVILFSLFSCGRQNGRPRAGETVMPQLDWPVHWTAGTSGELGVRLCAQGSDDKAVRLLDFSAIPLHVNPIANIAFYRDEQALGSLQVALSHRC